MRCARGRARTSTVGLLRSLNTARRERSRARESALYSLSRGSHRLAPSIARCHRSSARTRAARRGRLLWVARRCPRRTGRDRPTRSCRSSTQVQGRTKATRAAPVRRRLTARVQRGPGGPSAEHRARGRSRFWAEARDDGGRTASATLTGPEGYELTVRAALECVSRALRGEAPLGFQTPSLAYGADLVLAIEGVQRRSGEE